MNLMELPNLIGLVTSALTDSLVFSGLTGKISQLKILLRHYIIEKVFCHKVVTMLNLSTGAYIT